MQLTPEQQRLSDESSLIVGNAFRRFMNEECDGLDVLHLSPEEHEKALAGRKAYFVCNGLEYVSKKSGAAHAEMMHLFDR